MSVHGEAYDVDVSNKNVIRYLYVNKHRDYINIHYD